MVSAELTSKVKKKPTVMSWQEDCKQGALVSNSVMKTFLLPEPSHGYVLARMKSDCSGLP